MEDQLATIYDNIRIHEKHDRHLNMDLITGLLK